MDLARPVRALRRLAARLFSVWSERSRQRARLAELTEAQLRDIGLSRADVRRETEKPFWRA
jgi:uncharacterized protein YjiS (DUF1127 family)